MTSRERLFIAVRTRPQRQDCCGERCAGRSNCARHQLALAGRRMGDYSAPSLSAEGRCPNQIAAAAALAA